MNDSLKDIDCSHQKNDGTLILNEMNSNLENNWGNV